ncbi:MAG: nitrogenase component 1 [Brevinematales bacterium]|jgi:nitrogenase molybdenum-iron protein beta chain
MSSIIEQPRFSCALASLQSVLAIPKALPVVHAGPGCAGKIFAFASYGSGHQGEGYGGGGVISCTNTSEQEVVFGGEEKLQKLVEGAFQVLKGDLFVILSGCTSGIVGDDVVRVASMFASEGKPVVGVDTSGFKGNSYFGHELVVNEIINQFTGDVKPDARKGLVNVFSVVPFQDPYWRADLEEIKRLLEAVGLEANILFGNESKGVSEWRDIPNAEFNLVLSPWLGLGTARLLEKKYGTPYFHYPVLPVGARATSKFLRKLGEYAGLPEEQVEKVIKKEEKRFYQYFISLADFIADLRNNIPFELYTIADSAYALGTSDYLVNELGCTPKGIYVTEDPHPDFIAGIESALAALGEEFEGTLKFESDGGLIQQDIREKLGKSGKAVIFGSTWEAELAKENNNLLTHLSLPLNDDVIVTRSFVGYTGGLRLTEEIYAGIFRKGNIAQTTQTL